MITISNIRYNPKGEYIGRENKTFGVKESPLANPFPLKKECERDNIIGLYEIWLTQNVLRIENSPARTELNRLKKIYEETGKLNLVCWCFPRRCHGEVIRDEILKEREIKE